LSKKLALGITAIFAVCGIALSFLYYNGILLFNNPSLRVYPVRGIDVSSYQGEIDWSTLASADIQFVFIKATEGSDYVDRYYARNYANAANTDLRIGAYHFFSYDSPGMTQAQNFISVVSKTEDMLPPVADVEFYGDKEKYLPDKDSVVKELSDFLLALEAHYGKKPLIYATEKSYHLYIAGNFPNYNIWIRNVISHPSLSDNRKWTFWQYTNRRVLPGYAGKEKYIDLNVFAGSREEFDNYAKSEQK
jgi:lysozyme